MKPATAKAKGRETENAFVEFLRRNGVPHAERRRLTGSKDQGDITGWPGVCVEIKSGATLAIPKWLAECDAETANAHADIGFVVVRPKGKPDPADWFVILRPESLMGLMKEAGRV